MSQPVGSTAMPETRMVLRKEAAAYLKVSESWLERYEKQHPGDIKQYRFGRSVRYHLDDLDDFIARQAAG